MHAIARKIRGQDCALRGRAGGFERQIYAAFSSFGPERDGPGVLYPTRDRDWRRNRTSERPRGTKDCTYTELRRHSSYESFVVVVVVVVLAPPPFSPCPRQCSEHDEVRIGTARATSGTS